MMNKKDLKIILIAMLVVMGIQTIRIWHLENQYKDLYNATKLITDTYCTNDNGVVICKYEEEKGR